MKYCITLYLLLLVSSLSAFETYYYSAKAKDGDGVYSLLRRYHLNDHDCNRDHFLELNNMTMKDNLQVGKEYKLPIQIYKYNGTSIRTTIGIESWKQAGSIKEYNEIILTDKLRRTKYADSKILWVPYHTLSCHETKSDSKEKSESQPATPVVSSEKSSGTYLTSNLFGKDNSRFKLKDKSLKGKVYYIVSGHGGPDPGAMCKCDNTLCEDEYAYDVCLRLTRELMSHGATVHMICLLYTSPSPRDRG